MDAVSRKPRLLLALLTLLVGCSDSSAGPNVSQLLPAPAGTTSPLPSTPTPQITPTPVLIPVPTATPTLLPTLTPTPQLTPLPTSTPIPISAPGTPATINLTEAIEEILAATNLARTQNQLGLLQVNSQLMAAAQAHAEDMATRNYFSHTTPEGATVFNRTLAAGYPGTFVGENIARGSVNPEVIMQSWLQSPGHQANILNPDYADIGVGVVLSSQGSFWVQVFGR